MTSTTMKLFITSVLLLSCVTEIVLGLRDYRGYQLFRVTPRSGVQLQHLKRIEEQMIYTPPFDVDFWRSPSTLDEPVDFMINTKASEYILGGLEDLGLQPKTIIRNIEERIFLESVKGREANETDFFATYRTYEDIYDYLEVLRNLNPNSSSIEVIGKSYEGRDLKVLIIGNDDPGKKIVWIDGGTHAREWIGPATVMYMAASIATGNAACREALESARRNPYGRADSPSCPSEMRKLFSTYEFRIQPIVNPDGYVYAHKEDRLWRKTRSDSGITPWSLFCKGTDPNRNYDAKWGGEGSSGNPCSQTFAGRHAHSEPEIVALTDYVSKIKKSITFFLTLHSYSQIMLLPYGHSQDIPTEYPEIEKLALIGAQQFKQRGTDYSVGSAARILYPASGTASDWAFGQGIKYSYTFELPDTGDHGFLLPPERIKFVGEETWAAVQAMTYALIQ